MKLDRSSDDHIYQACVTWNVPALRDIRRDDVNHFMRTIQLLPSAFNDTTGSAPQRMTPVRRAAEGLKAELTGEREVARRHYEVVAKRQGLPGLLGTLLIAWMSEATENDFARVERKLDTIAGPGTRDVVARSHCKLSAWALDHGWIDRSHHHYKEALRHAGKDLRMTLEQVGHWFGGDQTFYMNRANGDMVSFPWIDELVDGAARSFVEKQLRDSVKSPWTRTWTFGSPSVEGLDIQSAEMQASWAGAIWMLPQINRLHAAFVLAKSNEPDDVARAIALWAKGNGPDTNGLVSAKEAALTRGTIEDLLVNQLHQGRSVHQRDTWLDICHALWAELPDQLVEELVRNFQGPALRTPLHGGTGAKELALFGKLLVRSNLAVERVYSFSDWEAGLLARAVHPQLLAELPSSLHARLLEAGISDVVLENADWADAGWASILTSWTLLDDEARAKYRAQLLLALPDSAIPTAVAIAPGLVPDARSEERLRISLDLLDKELLDARSGSWTGWGVHPAFDLARLAEARGRLDDAAVQRLVDIAVAPTTNSQQRQACLKALTSLAKANLVDRDQVEPVFAPVPVRSVMTDDVEVDQRLEDVTRLILMVQFSHQETTTEGALLAASRDTDTQVRRIAVAAVCQLSLQGQTSPSFDATLLGALYDPHPSVQAEAVPALWRGEFESHALREVARDRVVDIYPTAHRELRVTIAHEAALADGDDPDVQVLRQLASQDRSWLVRRAASPTRQ